MDPKLTDFLYALEKDPSQTVSLVLAGAIITGKFATPKRPSFYSGKWEYEGIMLLKSVSVHTGGSIAELAEITVPLESIIAWSTSKIKKVARRSAASQPED